VLRRYWSQKEIIKSINRYNEIWKLSSDNTFDSLAKAVCLHKMENKSIQHWILEKRGRNSVRAARCSDPHDIGVFWCVSLKNIQFPNRLNWIELLNMSWCRINPISGQLTRHSINAKQTHHCILKAPRAHILFNSAPWTGSRTCLLTNSTILYSDKKQALVIVKRAVDHKSARLPAFTPLGCVTSLGRLQRVKMQPANA
jgi:hypothetical protein